MLKAFLFFVLYLLFLSCGGGNRENLRTGLIQDGSIIYTKGNDNSVGFYSDIQAEPSRIDLKSGDLAVQIKIFGITRDKARVEITTKVYYSSDDRDTVSVWRDPSGRMLSAAKKAGKTVLTFSIGDQKVSVPFNAQGASVIPVPSKISADEDFQQAATRTPTTTPSEIAPTPTETATLTPSQTVTTTATETATMTPTQAITQTPVDTATATTIPTRTATSLPTSTPTNTSTPTQLPPTLKISSTTNQIWDCQTAQFKAELVYATGAITNVTSSANWSTSDASVASIDNLAHKGLLTAHVPGTIDVTATYGGTSAKMAFSVVYNTSLSFSSDIVFYENPIKAQPGLPGSEHIVFELRNLLATETITGGLWKIHSVDFSSIIVQVLAPRTRNTSTCLFAQQVDVQFKYKYVPETTKYNKQEFDFTVSSPGGPLNPYLLFGVISIWQTDTTVRRTYEGTQGNPDAR